MHLDNRSDFEASLFHGPDGPEHHGVAVLFKTLSPLHAKADPEFEWPVLQKEMNTDYGDFPMDHHLPLAKMDLVVCGHAHTPKGQARYVHQVNVKLGAFGYGHQVVGDRVWAKKMFGYEPTDPKPFTSMPLTLKQSYGGTLKMPFGDVPCPANPKGKGFLLNDVTAEGQALPNLERAGLALQDPYHVIDPVCMAPYPIGWKLRLDRLMGPEGVRPFHKDDSHLYFGVAHPDLQIDRPQPGTSIEIEGMHPEMTLNAEVPACPGKVFVIIDGKEAELNVTLDGIFVFAHLGWVGFKYRAAGRFVLGARQSREVRLQAVA